MDLSLTSTSLASLTLSPLENVEQGALEVFQVECQVDERIRRESRRTIQMAQESFQEIEKAIKKLSEENDALEKEVISSESRERQIAMAHQAELDALYAELAQTQQECEKLQTESVEISRQATQQIDVAAHAEVEGVRTINTFTQAQIAAIQQEAAATQSAALAQQRETYRTALTPISSELDTIHHTLDATIQECSPLMATSTHLEACIDSPDVVNSDSVITQISQFAKAKGQLEQSLYFKQLIQAPTEKLKALTHKLSQSSVAMHV